ncbi:MULTISPECIES: LysR family transcriptional regulator [unclassified Paraburkholderia]|uniref:LysR family transcriptional regulator n=1 Tax=unclassified Paraburkholderia TaxID=2615204 RepID=UPI0016120D19|nr:MULTISPECIES: LysR family transcriptional regulator [unclassified Paraburkholderia]MBB5447796.1 DNA-binding transcriptional LysR family regulator [Paraburkholderia sp. WSM4177]MBB5488267.1 DNA-binding transcriptional LysR family regulator [Paraburkholderia sp. WSM4180]
MDRLKALEVLRAVVDHAGFSRAAETMQMSTSTATRLIQELEDEMGVRILNRTTRKIALISVGECVYQRATSLLSSYDGCKDTWMRRLDSLDWPLRGKSILNGPNVSEYC